MILAIVLGLVIGLALGALGGGGSILAVPVLANVAGMSAGAATATSLVAVGAAAAVGAVGHARAGHVRWNAAGAFVLTAVPGAWLGAEINGRVDGDVLLLAFSGLILVAAHRMVTACPSCTRVGEEEAIEASEADPGVPATPSALVAGGKVLAAGTVVGFLTGLFGVGGGFVIVPALTLALGLSMPYAIGTSLVVIVGNAAVALGFRGVDAVDWDVAIPFTATMLVGSLTGALVAHRLPAQRSLQAFATLLVLVAVGNAAAAIAALTA